MAKASEEEKEEMKAFKQQTFVQQDGELHLTGLPCKKGDHLEVILLIHEQPTEEEQQEALRRFQEHARSSSFRSTGPYPSRDELHERH
jgi:hypothetical protein